MGGVAKAFRKLKFPTCDWLLFVVELSGFKAQTETKPEVVEAVQYCDFKTDQLTQ